ncbi:Exocyst complex component 2, partial [Eumeta japonica]
TSFTFQEIIMGPPPVVTGVSPKEGPPGTRVTIRGEFLGTSANDLIGLTICECDCLLSAEWKSKNKIVARSGPCKGRGDIIVTTRSGGEGTSTVQFRGSFIDDFGVHLSPCKDPFSQECIEVEGQKEGQLSLLKANTGAIMEQLDRLLILKNMFEEDQRKSGKEPVPSLEAAIEADEAFPEKTRYRRVEFTSRGGCGAKWHAPQDEVSALWTLADGTSMENQPVLLHLHKSMIVS